MGLNFAVRCLIELLVCVCSVIGRSVISSGLKFGLELRPPAVTETPGV